MNYRDLRLGGIIFAGVIILVSFVYAVNIQPVVIGNISILYTSFALHKRYSLHDF